MTTKQQHSLTFRIRVKANTQPRRHLSYMRHRSRGIVNTITCGASTELRRMLSVFFERHLEGPRGIVAPWSRIVRLSSTERSWASCFQRRGTYVILQKMGKKRRLSMKEERHRRRSSLEERRPKCCSPRQGCLAVISALQKRLISLCMLYLRSSSQ